MTKHIFLRDEYDVQVHAIVNGTSVMVSVKVPKENISIGENNAVFIDEDQLEVIVAKEVAKQRPSLAGQYMKVALVAMSSDELYRTAMSTISVKVLEPWYKHEGLMLQEVSFEQLLNSEAYMICEHWLLSNRRDKHNNLIDFTKPRLFNEFLALIGENMTSVNCKTLFADAKWFIMVKNDYLIGGPK